jgi:hypothetical protein
MIYRNWSLLSSTVVIWGGVATAGLAGIFLFGGKVLPSIPSLERVLARFRLRVCAVRARCLFVSAAPSVDWWYEAWIWLMHPWGIGLPPAIITNPRFGGSSGAYFYG